MELLAFLTQRWLVVALAIVGAMLVLAASLLAGRGSGAPPPPAAQILARLGYGLTFASIALFIVAGFLSGR